MRLTPWRLRKRSPRASACCSLMPPFVRALAVMGRGWLPTIATHRTNPVDTHETCNAVLAASLSRLAQVREDSGRSVDSVTRIERGADQLQEPRLLDCPTALRILQPRVIAAVGHLQDPAHLPHVVLVAMGPDELIDSLASSELNLVDIAAPWRPFERQIYVSTKAWEVHVDPLWTLMTGGLWAANCSRHRTSSKLLECQAGQNDTRPLQ